MSISFFGSDEKTFNRGGYDIRKANKKNFGKLVPLERKIDQGIEKGKINEKEAECLQNLCRSIRNWLYISLSDKHRLKGIELYESMNLIQQNVSKMRAYKDHEILKELENKLVNSTHGLQTDYEALKQGQGILRELTDLLYGQKDEKGNRLTQTYKEQADSQSIKQQVETLLNNRHEQFKSHSTEMRGYLKHFKDTHQRWATNLYTCYDFPKIPNDNNRLELSHSQMKKQYRRITGKSSTAQYLRNHGEQAAYLLAYARSNNSQQELEALIRNTDNEQLQKQKKRQLVKSNNRGKAMATMKKLVKTLKYAVQQWEDKD
ncbi:MAG: hypothetical protein AB8G86_08860 [Saprospiraceae bacterium]